MNTPEFPQVGRVYDAHLHRTIDGDTIDVVEFRPVRLRLLGVDTPETSEGISRLNAKNFTHAFCSSPYQPLRIQTATKDNFGRELAWVWDASGTSLNDALLEHGYAEEYGATVMIQAAMSGQQV